MSEKPRFLTKSRFRLALECPTKLFYTNKKDYFDGKINDQFLQALANGGFQVGELAKYYFPGGHDVKELDYQTALDKTNALLKEENVIIYEAAFQFESLFIRADIIVKKGKEIELYEVKAKSVKDANATFVGAKGGIESKWKPYIYDVAFQKYVIQKAFPQFSLKTYLMLADKTARATVDGLNQKFVIRKDGEDKNDVQIVGDVSLVALGEKILCAINVDSIIDPIYEAEMFVDRPERSFIGWIDFFAKKYETDSLISANVSSKCTKCEFKIPVWDGLGEMKSGFHECWQREAGFKAEDFIRPSVLSIWDYRKDSLLEQKKYFQSDISPDELRPKKESVKDVPGMSRVERQILQITKSNKLDTSEFLDKIGLKIVFNDFVYPLHFIDFETCAVAIPFNAGRRPYEQIAFQFSHHKVEADGEISHAGQWLNIVAGSFPNFEFLRALKEELSKDNGTIFRYAAHENSVLNAIHQQLENSGEADKEELCVFIREITTSSSSSASSWNGKRKMVDLREMVLRYYYSPATNGSNSIKDILPAILDSSKYLKDKYSSPIYGAEIPSLNFKDKIWITFDEKGKVINPYKTLESTFSGIDQELLDNLISDEDGEIADGGAAMAAYAKMQFSQMGEIEKEKLKNSLLRYCELDTMAMVMIYEHWKNNI